MPESDVSSDVSSEGVSLDGADPRRAPAGVDSAVIEALGKVSEALETADRARGHLYAFHQLSGSADLALGDGIKQLRTAGCEAVADRLEREILGRNVLDGRWTFEIVEEYDDTYWSVFREQERLAREDLVDGRRHLYEAQMKRDEQSDPPRF